MSDQLTVYNTLGRTEQPFEPQSSDVVNMYVCGVTVYDDCHVGHGRAYVTFDVIRRFLEHEGYEVNYVENFTDVDDKIINRADEEGKTWDEVAQENIEAYTDVMARLNIRHAEETDDPEVSPRVSGCIPEIIEHVEGLIDNGSAYEVEGDVFFDIESFPEYGKLSGQDIDEMKSGSRVDVDERKQSPLDFALWKSVSAEEEEQGAPAWDSPWGRGRPGWHIECSVMAQSRLGDTLDIHGGGQDLIFPHHENEIAQSEGLTGKPFANYWIHNGFVTIDDEKMSKSEGNFYTLKELMDGVEMDGETVAFDPMTIRFFILTRHYRSPIDFSFDRLKEAEKSLNRIREGVKRLRRAMNNDQITQKKGTYEVQPFLEEVEDKFFSALRADFNTADALGHIQTAVNHWNGILSDQDESLTTHQKTLAFNFLNFLDEAFVGVLGIPLEESEKEVTAQAKKATIKFEPKEGKRKEYTLNEIIDLRDEAREKGNYERADELREEIQKQGYKVIDTPQGTELEPIDE